jgi:hypothetical protein
MMCVSALGLLGYLTLTSHLLYDSLGPTAANVLIGILSAVLDNIPLTYAVLTMQPEMPLAQWLLLTLTAGGGFVDFYDKRHVRDRPTARPSLPTFSRRRGRSGRICC